MFGMCQQHTCLVTVTSPSPQEITLLWQSAMIQSEILPFMWLICLKSILHIRVVSRCMIFHDHWHPFSALALHHFIWASLHQPVHLSCVHCQLSSSSRLVHADPTFSWAQTLPTIISLLIPCYQVSQCGEMQFTMLNSWCSSAAFYKTWHLYRSWINPGAPGLFWAAAQSCDQCLSCCVGVLGTSWDPELLSGRDKTGRGDH